MNQIMEILDGRCLIAASSYLHLSQAIESDVSAVIFMEGSILEVVKKSFSVMGKIKPIFVHLDLMKGLAHDEDGIAFLAKFTTIKGIVTTKAPLVTIAKKYKLLTIQRVFLIDTRSLDHSIQSIQKTGPDAVEIMPAIGSSIIAKIKEKIDIPIITGGLVHNSNQIQTSFDDGADAVSFSNPNLWVREGERER